MRASHRRVATLLLTALLAGTNADKTIVFKLRPTLRSTAGALKSITTSARLGAGAKRVFRHAGKFEERHRAHGLHLWYEATIDDNSTAPALASLRRRSSLVTSASVRPEKRLYGFGGGASGPNDPRYSEQTHYRARPHSRPAPLCAARALHPAPPPPRPATRGLASTERRGPSATRRAP